MTPLAEKQCTKCGETKFLTEYYFCKSNADRRQGVCKSCWKTRQVKQMRSETRKRWEKKRWQRPEYREYQRQRAYVWKNENREKVEAHYAVRDAIRNGEMKRGRCSVCGSVRMVDAHHHDYSQPLNVTWLCRKHHGEAQRTRRDVK